MPAPADLSHAVATLTAAGFDLVHFFPARELVPFTPQPVRPRLSGETAVLVGNTAKLWPPFSRNYEELSARHTHPLDGYTEEQVSAGLSSLGIQWIAYAHQLEPEPIPIQRIAAAARFAPVGPVGLNIHPTYGPWFALRAVAILARSYLPSAPTKEAPCARCARPCLAPFEKAQSAPDPTNTRHYLPVRDACPVGREHRYSEAQLAYHYDHSPACRT